MPEPVPTLSIVKQHVNDVVVLTLTGELRLEDGDDRFRRCLQDLVAGGANRIVLDLGGVTSIDSSGVGQMVAKLKRVRESGGDIRLVHLTSRSERVLAVMKIMSIFDRYDDVDAAVRSFSA
jgi:anti-sigma B factor antagonist